MAAFVDTSFYIARLMHLLQARGFFSAAVSFLREARLNASVSVIHPDTVPQSEAWDLFARWGRHARTPSIA